jgi:hypothetical protein
MAEEQARLIDERLATKADIASLELRIEEVRGSLARDIEQLRGSVAHDIEQLRGSLARDIEQLRAEGKSANDLLRRDMELLRRDVVIRLGSIVIASVAVGSTVVTLFSRLHP